MADIQQEHQRFRELLPFYLNGTLDAADRTFVEDYLHNYPEAQAELEFARHMRLATKNMYADRAADEGLDRLLRAWHRDKHHPSWSEQMLLKFRSWGLTPAFAVAASLVVVQTVLLVTHLSPETGVTGSETERFRGSTGQVNAKADLKITVSPKAAFGDLAVLLRANGCRIIAGPTESGEVWVTLENRPELELIRQRLIRSSLVEDVVIAGTPDR